ncbi:heavy metal-responsive transcriptional regulator [Tsukamurella sputi]|uniref:Heavy metal-responsive transcriptional regulator n=2 Tax=Tsukamurella TaxID=2060 RepID=A0A5C5RMD2_9ACTN|nr:heavy metal-responsive transcriptional regulator [Tsukamurella sputi]
MMKIGELARQSGIATKTLRFYEHSGLLPEPARTTSGYRDYEPESIERLHFIRSAQAAGLTLREVREILNLHDQGLTPCDQVVRLLTERLAHVHNTLQELRSLEGTLTSLLDRAQRGGPAQDAGVCWILEPEIS